jgi:hypothetical protein
VREAAQGSVPVQLDGVSLAEVAASEFEA